MIQTIAFITGGIGLLLILLLAGRLKAAFEHDKLTKHRSTQAGVSDLLNYAAMVDDGVIVGKNGSFMAAYLYAGDDNASSTDEERNNVALRMNQALAALGVVSRDVVPHSAESGGRRAMFGGGVWPTPVVVVHPGLQLGRSRV